MKHTKKSPMRKKDLHNQIKELIERSHTRSYIVIETLEGVKSEIITEINEKKDLNTIR